MSQTKNAPESTVTESPVALTLETAEARIADLLKQVGEKDDQIVVLTQQAETAQTAHDELKGLFDDQAEALAGVEAEKAQLAAKVAKLQAKPQPYPTVDVEGVSYAITTPTFQYRKVEYAAAQLATLPELAAELVKKGMGFLQPLTAAE